MNHSRPGSGRHAGIMPAAASALTACASEAEEPAPEATPAPAHPALVLLDSVPVIMERADVPGLQLAYMESGEVTMTAAFGYADTEARTPVTDNTVFEAASLSKPVFAYAVLRMADRGEWDLDQPLWDVLE